MPESISQTAVRRRNAIYLGPEQDWFLGRAAEETVGKICSIRNRCHVRGQGITKFGTKFSPEMVRRLASSSVQFIDRDVPKRFASGTLIWPNVVLCSVHSLHGTRTSKLEMLFFFECNAKTAPAPYATSAPCTELASKPQATFFKELENGDRFGLDYALLAIDWTSPIPVGFPPVGATLVDLPEAVHIPSPSYESRGEVLAIGHPEPEPARGQGEQTQAAAGELLSTRGPHLDDQWDAGVKSKAYSHSSFKTWHGMSGGGVFNEAGNIVGVISGRRAGSTVEGKFSFLDLGEVARKIVKDDKGRSRPASQRIKQWLGGGPPLLPGDPQPLYNIMLGS